MLKVAIIGAGQIAEAHIGEVAKIEGAEVIALCDLLESPAQALAEKFDIPHTYSNAEQMLEELKPDVVHLTTPPTSHYALGSLCIEAGAHIYVEKPLTVTADETEKLLNLARENGKKVCLGANRVFSRAQRSADTAIQAGRLGDLVHIDSFFTYDLSGIFGKQVLSDPNHWIARLPGQIFQNNFNHPLTPILPHLSDQVEVEAWAADFSGNGVVFDELRIRFTDAENKITANITFSSNSKPGAFRIAYYGSKASMQLDNMSHTIQFYEQPKVPGTLGQILSIKGLSRQLAKQFWRALYRFFLGKETFFTDMKLLMEDFYHSIKQNKSSVISDAELSLASRIMDDILLQIGRPGDERS